IERAPARREQFRHGEAGPLQLPGFIQTTSPGCVPEVQASWRPHIGEAIDEAIRTGEYGSHAKHRGWAAIDADAGSHAKQRVVKIRPVAAALLDRHDMIEVG